MPDTVVDRTRRIVAEVFGLGLQEVSLKTSQNDIENWDSLNILNLLMAVESEFGVSISPEEAADFLSVASIVAVLRNKGVE